MNNPAQKSYQLYIGGEWVDASDGGTLDVYCPANGEQLSVIADATKEDVDRAVDAAWEAFETWSKTTKAERAIILNKVADLIEENAEKLALLESLDNGKPIRETRAIDVAYSVDHFRYFAGVLLADTGEADMLPGNMMSLVLHEPIGVVGQIVPWNFPFLMAAWKLAPVLAAGDCTVFKPSSTTSLTVLELAKLTEGVIPAGVFNVVTGRGSKSGQYILDNPKISKLAFTGSTEVGRDVARAAAERLIPATLELGGKSANIIFPDAKWDMMLDGIQLGILFNQGQVCCAGSRIFVHEDIYDKFVQDACEAFGKVKVGLPWEDDTQMGSQIDQNQMNKILEYVEIAKQEGADAICHGCTGKGNDQVRFELAIKRFAPEIKIIAPWREWDIKSRDEEVDYAEAHNVPLKISRETNYSKDKNLWHLSHEGLDLEDPANEPQYDKPGFLEMGVSPAMAPDAPAYVTIDLEKGWPAAVDGVKMKASDLIRRLNELGGANGIGLLDIVENRLVGMKDRGVYETPGGTILYRAHEVLEQITLDKDTKHMKQKLAVDFADLVYNGKWFTPLREALTAFATDTQKYVTGTVKLKLYKGNLITASVSSPCTLYSENLVTFGESDYDQTDSQGFINLWGLPDKVQALREQGKL